MALNKYFNWPQSLRRFVRFDAARSEDVNSALDEISTGLGSVDIDTRRSLKLPPSADDHVLNLTAVQRAGLMLCFDATGRLAAVAGGGRFTGDWAAGRNYVAGDIFRDPATKNLYGVIAAHTATTVAADLAAGKVQLAVNVIDIELARDAAAASVADAANQVALATAQAVISAEQAAMAAFQADAARALVNFAGVWTALSGPLTRPATVHHNGFFWVLANNLPDVALSEPGITADWVVTGGDVAFLPYSRRGELRLRAGDMVVVDGLGLFKHVMGSDEPDDDESCFATGIGRWLLQAAHWDLVDAWRAHDDAARDEFDEDSRASGRLLSGLAACTVETVAAQSCASFEGIVAGAMPGDRVLVAPPAELGASPADSARLSYQAWVSKPDTITVLLCATIQTTTVNPEVRTRWPITVLQN